MSKVEQLQKLGFKKASSKLNEQLEFKRKMAIAYEHYRYAKQELIDKFNKKLKAGTLKEQGKAGSNLQHQYDQLISIKVGDYTEVPPAEALTKMEVAVERKCFDYFEIAKVESVVEYKDPILFGRIKGCPDRFFISQWGSDVTIEEILGKNQG